MHQHSPIIITPSHTKHCQTSRMFESQKVGEGDGDSGVINESEMRQSYKQSNEQQICENCDNLITVKPLISKAKELIAASAIKHVYPELWEEGSTDEMMGEYSSTENQAKYHQNVGRNRNKKNRRFEHVNASLQQRAESGQFGDLIYSRFGTESKMDNLWKPACHLHPLKPHPKKKNSIHVEFESRFQSGNMNQCFHSEERANTYFLILQNDTNTFGYNQWFYFKARAPKPYETYRFEIVNMRKNYSLHERGMKIAVFSELLQRDEGRNWHRAGANIEYSCNNLCSNLSVGDQGMSSLGWEYTFQDCTSWVCFAYSYPYTYTQLKDSLAQLRNREHEGIELNKLCLTIMKNPVYGIKITAAHHPGQAATKNRYIANETDQMRSKELLPSKNYNASHPNNEAMKKKSSVQLADRSPSPNIKIRKRVANNLSLISEPQKGQQGQLESVTASMSKKLKIQKRELLTISHKTTGNSPLMREKRANLQKQSIMTLNPVQVPGEGEYRSNKQSSNDIVKFSVCDESQLKATIMQDTKSEAIAMDTFSRPSKLEKFMKKYEQANSHQSIKEVREIKEEPKKDILLIMARVHPGQTVSSHVLNGCLSSLLPQRGPIKSLHESDYLKSCLDIHIIPMLNPDGVVHGNTRTSLSGNDLNRRWASPSEKIHPEIYYLKKYITRLVKKGHKLFAVIDLHGHTGKESAFLYGCCDRSNFLRHRDVKLLNSITGEIDPYAFNPLFSNHHVSPSKYSTSRVTFFKEFQAFSFTLESSFMGATESPLHFSVRDYENIGRNLIKSLAIFRETLTPRPSGNPRFNEVLLSSILQQKGQSSSSIQIKINGCKISTLLKGHRENQQSLSKKSKKEIVQILQKEYEADLQEAEKESQGSDSCPSEFNFDDSFIEQQVQPEDQGKGLWNNQTKEAAENKRKARAERSFSITDKKNAQETPDTCELSKRNLSMKNGIASETARRSLVNKKQKLPILTIPRREQVQNTPIPSSAPLITNSFFHAFNFKARKPSLYKKKASLNPSVEMMSSINE